MNEILNAPVTLEEGEFRKYPYRIYWSDEDECFIGHAQIAGGNCCHGDSPEEVRRQLEVVMELCLEIENQDRETSEIAPTRPH